jgi:hypothetical protein
LFLKKMADCFAAGAAGSKATRSHSLGTSPKGSEDWLLKKLPTLCKHYKRVDFFALKYFYVKI